MSADIVPLRSGVPLVQNCPEDLARRFEELARQVRDGELDIATGHVVFLDSNGVADRKGFGAATSRMESVGLLHWAIHDIMHPEDEHADR